MKKFIIDLIFSIIKLLIFLWLYKKVGFELTIILILCEIILYLNKLDKGE
jgi:hypothetical protein